MKTLIRLVLTCSLAFGSTLLHANDPVEEFSITANPNGVWSYGYATTLAGSFTLYPTAYATYLGVQGSDIWTLPPGACPDGRTPDVGRVQVQLFVGLVPVPFDTLYVHPGCQGQYTIVRWTAPLAGTYQIKGSFSGLVGQVSTTDVHILSNSTTSLLDQEITGPGEAALFNLQQPVAAGDTLDFAVGFGSDGNYFGDSMGLQFTIDLVTAINIKPADPTNTINRSSPSRIPVAILSTATFNAVTSVDRTSLTFGRIGDEQSLGFWTTQICPKAACVVHTPACDTADVDGDGLPDLVCRFDVHKTGFQLTDSQGVLRGKTLTGVSIKGTDSVKIK